MFDKDYITAYIKTESERQSASGNDEVRRKIEDFRISFAGYGHVVDKFAQPRAAEIASLISGISPDPSKKFGYSHWRKIATHQAIEFVLMNWVWGRLSDEAARDLEIICRTVEIAA